MWGRRRKSPSSHSHTDGFHMGFIGKAPLDASTTVNRLLCCFDVADVFGLLLQSAFHRRCIIAGL